jgi:hypothetical protein
MRCPIFRKEPTKVKAEKFGGHQNQERVKGVVLSY